MLVHLEEDVERLGSSTVEGAVRSQVNATLLRERNGASRAPAKRILGSLENGPHGIRRTRES